MAARVAYLMQKNPVDLSVLSGPQLHVLAVINGLRTLGHHVRVVVADRRGRAVWSDDLQQWAEAPCGITRTRRFRLFESGVRRAQTELRLPFFGAFDSARFADACVNALGGFDLLYERHGYMGFGGVLAARRLGVPHVLELNGNIVREIDEMAVEMSFTQRRVGRFVTARTMHSTDRVVVVSEALKQTLVDSLGIAAGKVSVVLNGVDLDLFARGADQGAVRVRYGIRSRPVVVFTGSYQPWHGVGLLIDAFALVRRQYRDAQLVLVGDGAGRDAALRQVATLGLEGGTVMTGRLAQPEVAAVLSVADVVVAPYPYTHDDIVGTPLKILEYMAAGKPIVASTARIHEIVQDGVTGIRVAPADADALADGIVQVLSDRRMAEALGASARRLAGDYSWAHVVGRLCAVLATLSPKFKAAPAQDRSGQSMQAVDGHTAHATESA